MMMVELNWLGIFVFREVFCVKGELGCKRGFGEEIYIKKSEFNKFEE